VQRTKDSLIRGLSASTRHGQSIAVTFALRHGVLDLSVCTVQRETFQNVIVDLRTWKVVAVEPITSGDALAAAHAQRAAMAKHHLVG
jgi:fructose-1,6-bisphosphatase/sedoheptulose 1,7-bisphosphatase-like protein